MLAPRSCSRAVISAGAPLAHESLEFGIGGAGKRHRKLHVLIASAPITTRYALALEPQHATAVGPLGYVHADGSVRGRHLDLAAEHGRAKRDRQLHADVIVVTGKKRVGTHGDFDQGIARRAAVDPRHPLAAQPQDLAFAGPGWDRNVKGGALGQGHLLLAAIDGIEEAEFEPVADILPRHAELAAAAAAKDLGQDLVRSRHICKPVGAGVAILRATGVFTIKAARRTLGAGGIDLPIVVAPTFFWVANQIVSGGGPLELFFAFFVAWVEVGMQLFCQGAVGLSDLILGGVFGDA